MNGLTILETFGNPAKPAPAPSAAPAKSVLDLDTFRNSDWTDEMFTIAASKLGQRAKGKLKTRRVPVAAPAPVSP